jgi:hypothetical protein
MKRKVEHSSVSRLLFRSNNKRSPDSHPPKEDELTVQVSLQGRKPMTLKVPARCNMKILRSMILFHLKKTLPTN